MFKKLLNESTKTKQTYWTSCVLVSKKKPRTWYSKVNRDLDFRNNLIPCKSLRLVSPTAYTPPVSSKWYTLYWNACSRTNSLTLLFYILSVPLSFSNTREIVMSCKKKKHSGTYIALRYIYLLSSNNVIADILI